MNDDIKAGKNRVADQWKRFSESTIPSTMNSDNTKVLERTFYAGAVALLETLLKEVQQMQSRCDNPQHDITLLLCDVSDELYEYSQSVQASKR